MSNMAKTSHFLFISLPFAKRQQVNLLRCTTQYRAKRPSVLCNKKNRHKKNVNVHDWKRTDYWVWCLTPLSTNFSGVPGSVLLVEENRVHRENHGPATSHWQTLSHNVVSSRRDSNLLVVIGTDCIYMYRYL